MTWKQRMIITMMIIIIIIMILNKRDSVLLECCNGICKDRADALSVYSAQMHYTTVHMGGV